MKRKCLSKRLMLAITMATIFTVNSTLPIYAAVDKNNATAAVQNESKRYTVSYLKTLNYYDLVDLLVKTEIENLPDLFQYSSDAKEFYGNKTRMSFIMDEIGRRAPQYTEIDHKGIPTLVEVVRAGFYLGFHNKELNEINKRSFKERVIPSILAIQKNPNFKLGTEVQDKIVSATGLLAGNETAPPEVVNNFTPILQDCIKNIDRYALDDLKSKALFNVLAAPTYDITEYLRATKEKPENTPWYGKIDGFINELKKLALYGKINDNNSWIIDNGIYHIAPLGKLHSNNKIGIETLTEVMKVYPYLSMQHLQSADQIKRHYDSKDAEGNKIPLDKFKKEGKEKYCPKTYTFDDGKVIIKAGARVEEEKVKRLYWASKEVNSQFFRVYGIDKPLEEGNPDDILTMVIYNSPEEYKLNSVLYGYDTNNGGMYIEPEGTFFTYEREAQESTYTLEELFRHEYTHYLQGRYAVPGQWGRTKLYDNDRLTWYEEGGAELFAGSTRTSGILPRKSIVSNIHNTTRNNRYKLSDTVHSKYGASFEFYNYACMFMDYMYNKDMGILNKLNDLAKNNDVDGYDNYIRDLSSNYALNDKYQDHMQERIDNYENLTVPFVADDYLVRHAYKNPNEIYSEISEVAKLKDAKSEVKKSQYFSTFTLRGSYTGGASKGKLEDQKAMNKFIDDSLKKLDTYSWSGYKTLTAYFTNYKVDSSNRVTYDVVFHGYLPNEGDSKNSLPYGKINGTYKGTEKEKIKFSSEGSFDPDGKIVSYEWDFGDGNKSNEENPEHSYDKVGTYTVKLKVTDDKGESSVSTTTAEIKDLSENKLPVIYMHVPKSGALNQKVVFYGKGTYDPDGSIAGYQWDFGDGSDFSSEQNPSHVYTKKGEYTVTLRVMDSSGQMSEKTMKIKITDPVYPIGTEKEPNNSKETASGPIVPGIPVSGTIENTSDQDYFYFDVITPGEVKIDINKLGYGGATWVVYDENNNAVSYATDDGQNLSGKFKADKPGRYYIHLYMFNGSYMPYRINIEGSVGR
ncbi:collagenase [Hathewaya histolytica]|uniref:Collagenase ColH n=5 Tax=Hathewaya histolytica TaxID=1498 RepID=COLH_HATHI|nr:collagenase [Hathewaya histolytica]Q46085.1 RecName: Full=Collagenase ColH; AltName: Full=Class II collagenase; AltName: Full=Gelatinase ColH; AltName: Full=Microbial collagenase; Flags: Precursor [Hathewaya histolytica]BAA06251.1 collagenase precursor [Hathewaya histolytica]BAA34542.1 colH [Hathewaya histolytica]VTQ92554.1 collagenase [Hathewaya histolytica]